MTEGLQFINVTKVALLNAVGYSETQCNIVDPFGNLAKLSTSGHDDIPVDARILLSMHF